MITACQSASKSRYVLATCSVAAESIMKLIRKSVCRSISLICRLPVSIPQTPTAGVMRVLVFAQSIRSTLEIYWYNQTNHFSNFGGWGEFSQFRSSLSRDRAH